MTEPETFDDQAAHRHFAKTCFNAVWELIDKPQRSPADDEEMLMLAHASAWHWSRVEDFSPRNASVGYWQLSRAHALAGDEDAAHRYGRRCLEVSTANEIAPFYVGYAHEALARAALLAGDGPDARRALAEARRALEQVDDEEDAKVLRGDLDELEKLAGR